MSKIEIGARYNSRDSQSIYAMVDGWCIDIEIINEEVYLCNLNIFSTKMSDIESRLARLRGFFSHKENLAKVIELNREIEGVRSRGHNTSLIIVDEAQDTPHHTGLCNDEYQSNHTYREHGIVTSQREPMRISLAASTTTA